MFVNVFITSNITSLNHTLTTEQLILESQLSAQMPLTVKVAVHTQTHAPPPTQAFSQHKSAATHQPTGISHQTVAY